MNVMMRPAGDPWHKCSCQQNTTCTDACLRLNALLPAGAGLDAEPAHAVLSAAQLPRQHCHPPGVVLGAQQQLWRPVPDRDLCVQLYPRQRECRRLAQPCLAQLMFVVVMQQVRISVLQAVLTTTPFSDRGRSGSRTKRARPKSPTFTLPCSHSNRWQDVMRSARAAGCLQCSRRSDMGRRQAG